MNLYLFCICRIEDLNFLLLSQVLLHGSIRMEAVDLTTHFNVCYTWVSTTHHLLSSIKMKYKKPKKHEYDLTASCRWASNIRLHKNVYIAHTVNVSVDVLMINIKIAFPQSPLHAFLMAKWLQANTLSFKAVLGSVVVTFLF